MLHKLSFKIGLLFLGFIVMIETFLFLILYMDLANERLREVMNNLGGRGIAHRDVLEDHLNRTTLNHVALMESATDFTVVITNQAQEVLASSDPLDAEMEQMISRNMGKRLDVDGEIIESNWKEARYIATASPIKDQGTVYMFANTTNIKHIMEHLTNQFVLSGVVIIVLTLIVIWILSKFFTKPLIHMKYATENLSKKGYKTDGLAIERRDELGDLAREITKLGNNLEEMKKDRNEFLTSISHELRTPLAYIKGYADIIVRPSAQESEIREYALIIKDASSQMTNLIKNLFELAKMDAKQFPIHMKTMEVRPFLHSISERMSPLFQEAGMRLEVHSPPHLSVYADPERLRQVLYNVLDNARKHSVTGDTIMMYTEETKESIRIIVKDEGEGIPAEHLPYLFERMYRVDQSRSRSNGGSGLGLAIAKEIIQAHNGSIMIESIEGEHTTVIMELPRRETNGKRSASR